MIVILVNDITSQNIIDHINGNILDNQFENLRIVTYSENSRNRKKPKNATSKYIGVSKNKEKWEASIRYDGKQISTRVEIEIHAAWQYNVWIKEFNIKNAKINDIAEPKNFIPYKKKPNKILPVGISQKGERFHVEIYIKKKQNISEHMIH